MGEQRRYAAALEKRSLERLNRELMAQGPPDGLREWEVDLERLALTTTASHPVDPSIRIREYLTHNEWTWLGL